MFDQVDNLDGLPLIDDPKKKIKISHEIRDDSWNKKSILFDLSYWKTIITRILYDIIGP